MPRFQITAPDGRLVTVEGDTAPTEKDATEIFASLPPKEKAGASFAPDQVSSAIANPQGDAEQRLREREAIAVRTGVRREKERIVRENVEAGVPLNPEEELPAVMRARLSFEGNIDKQVEQLAKRDDVLGARKTKDGRNVIVRISGENGPRDVLLHPKGALTAGDFAGAAAPLLKAGTMAAVGAVTAPASLPLATLAAGGTAATAEAMSSGGSRLFAGQEIDPKELAGASAKEGVINAALPLAIGGGKAALGGIRRALTSGAGELERKLPAAASRLGIEPSLAETTGSPIVAKLGRLTPEEESSRQMALRIAKDRGVAAGKPMPLASESDIASEVQPVFAQAEQASAKGVSTAMTNAEKAAQAQIQTELDSGIIPTTRSTSEVGDFIRNKIAGKMDSRTAELRANAEKLYGTANAIAEAEGITVAPNAVAKLRGELDEDTHRALLEFAPGIKKIPALERLLTEETTTNTGVLDAAGKAISETAPPPPLTIPQARELRAVVYEMAHGGGTAPGEGGVPKRYLTRLYKALDDDLDAAIKGGSDELRLSHSIADTYYKSKIQPLQQSDVAKLFLETDAAGRMGGDEIVERLFRGEGNLDALRAYRNVLGEKSPEWKLLVRQGLQTMIDDAGRGGRSDAGRFLTRLNTLKTELADEIIGPVAMNLRSNARLMARAQGVKIPEDELADALAAAPSKVGKLLEEAIQRETAHDLQYNSAIQKQLRDGTLTPRTIGSPDDFLTRFIEGRQTSAADIRQALTQIGAKSPEAVEQIRQRALQNVLDRARAKPALGRVTTGETEDLNHEILASSLEGDELKRLQAIIGDRGVQFLKDLATYSEATAKRLVNESGRRVAPETMAKEGISGFIGFKRNAVGALVDASAATTRALGGGAAVRNPAVRTFIETGRLPQLGPLARAGIFATPDALDAKGEIEGEKRLSSEAKPGTHNKRAEKLPLAK